MIKFSYSYVYHQLVSDNNNANSAADKSDKVAPYKTWPFPAVAVYTCSDRLEEVEGNATDTQYLNRKVCCPNLCLCLF